MFGFALMPVHDKGVGELWRVFVHIRMVYFLWFCWHFPTHQIPRFVYVYTVLLQYIKDFGIIFSTCIIVAS